MLKGLYPGSISIYRNSKKNPKKWLEKEKQREKFVDNVFWLYLADCHIWKYILDPEHSLSNSKATLDTRNVIVSSY